jgi:hypothetical protein
MLTVVLFKNREKTMKLGKLADIYYTAAEARKVLGIDEDTFQYWGKSQRIKRIYLPGRKQAVYSRKEINDMANRIEAVAIVEKGDGIEFKKATLSDLDEEYKLARLTFGRNADTEEIRKGKQAFLEKNPDINYHLYDHGNFVGCIDIIPLKHEAIVDFLQGKVIAWLIDPENIEQFEPGKPLECLIIDMLTTPGVEPFKRSSYAARMISNFINVLIEWGNQGVEVSKVYAASNTPSGIRVLKNAGFQIIDENDKGRICFELDINKSNERILRSYKEALERWKQNSNMSKEVYKPKNYRKTGRNT